MQLGVLQVQDLRIGGGRAPVKRDLVVLDFRYMSYQLIASITSFDSAKGHGCSARNLLFRLSCMPPHLVLHSLFSMDGAPSNLYPQSGYVHLETVLHFQLPAASGDSARETSEQYGFK